MCCFSTNDVGFFLFFFLWLIYGLFMVKGHHIGLHALKRL